MPASIPGGKGYVFVCYLDDSDNDQGNAITLAGYVASLENWRVYEDRSRQIYNSYGVGDVLHAMEFNGSKPPFKGWSVARKLSLINELLSCSGFSLGVSMSLDKASFQRNKENPAIGPNMSPLGLAFSIIMHQLVRRNPLAGFIQSSGLSFVIESGHKNNSGLERYFHKFKDNPLFLDCLQSISFVDKLDSRAIHLADMLAFYSRRQAALDMSYRRVGLDAATNRYLQLMTSKFPHLLTASNIDHITPAQPEEADTAWFPVPINYRDLKRQDPV
jgi:hypothetical protein